MISLGLGKHALTWAATANSRRSSHQLLGARQDFWGGICGGLAAQDEANDGQDERDRRGHQQA
jgi:hypothetical protein